MLIFSILHFTLYHFLHPVEILIKCIFAFVCLFSRFTRQNVTNSRVQSWLKCGSYIVVVGISIGWNENYYGMVAVWGFCLVTGVMVVLVLVLVYFGLCHRNIDKVVNVFWCWYGGDGIFVMVCLWRGGGDGIVVMVCWLSYGGNGIVVIILWWWWNSADVIWWLG